MTPLDELLEKWRGSDGDKQLTLALCTLLPKSGRDDVMAEVAERALSGNDDPDLIAAVAKMHLGAGALSEAQPLLVRAAKLAPKDATVFHSLGVLLLRRGDAVRAKKILEKALALGSIDADTKMWRDRAEVYITLQERVGAHAVADDIERALPRRSSQPPPPNDGEAAAGVAEAEGELAGMSAASDGAPPADLTPMSALPTTPPQRKKSSSAGFVVGLVVVAALAAAAYAFMR